MLQISRGCYCSKALYRKVKMGEQQSTFGDCFFGSVLVMLDKYTYLVNISPQFLKHTDVFSRMACNIDIVPLLISLFY